MSKKRLKGHKTPLERMIDNFTSIALENGVMTYEEIEAIKSKEYAIKDSREARHGTSTRSILSDNYKNVDSYTSFGKQIIPEGIDNISGRELLARLKDAMISPVHFNTKKKYKKTQ